MIHTEPFNGPSPGIGASGVKQTRIEDMARDVVAFHRKFGIEYGGKPRLLPDPILQARVLRTREEIDEWVSAHGEDDLPGSLDAIVDLIYFALGNAHLQGFTPEMFYEAWSRVHRANMAKERASESNPGKHGSHENFCDIVKPPGWQAPDHSDIIEEASK